MLSEDVVKDDLNVGDVGALVFKCTLSYDLCIILPFQSKKLFYILVKI